jgi:hypothetical protein
MPKQLFLCKRLDVLITIGYILITPTLKGQQLPAKAYYSRFRIKVLDSKNSDIDSLKVKNEFIRNELRINAYLVKRKKGRVILVGDFTRKSSARNKLLRIRKSYERAKITRAENDAVVWFQLYNRKKQILPTTEKEVSQNHENRPPDKNAALLDLEVTKDLYRKWNEKVFLEANTAVTASYLTEAEIKVIFYLNLVRLNPGLFAETFLIERIGEPDSENEISLYNELHQMKALPCLLSNKQCWESAKCHAVFSGNTGYVGHDRHNCESYFWGECCQYGSSDPLNIILQLLIDEGVPSLGHRRICLGSYHEIGVSIQPHSGYGSNAVLDFR